MEVEAVNSAGAKIGDTVVIGIDTAPLLKYSGLTYIFPIISMIIGAFIGQKLGEYLHYGENGMSVIFSFLFLGISFMIVRAIGKNLKTQDVLRAKVIRISRSETVL